MKWAKNWNETRLHWIIKSCIQLKIQIDFKNVIVFFTIHLFLKHSKNEYEMKTWMQQHRYFHSIRNKCRSVSLFSFSASGKKSYFCFQFTHRCTINDACIENYTKTSIKMNETLVCSNTSLSHHIFAKIARFSHFFQLFFSFARLVRFGGEYGLCLVWWQVLCYRTAKKIVSKRKASLSKHMI